MPTLQSAVSYFNKMTRSQFAYEFFTQRIIDMRSNNTGRYDLILKYINSYQTYGTKREILEDLIALYNHIVQNKKLQDAQIEEYLKFLNTYYEGVERCLDDDDNHLDNVFTYYNKTAHRLHDGKAARSADEAWGLLVGKVAEEHNHLKLKGTVQPIYTNPIAQEGIDGYALVYWCGAFPKPITINANGNEHNLYMVACRVSFLGGDHTEQERLVSYKTFESIENVT